MDANQKTPVHALAAAEAAMWFARHRRGPLSKADVLEHESWLRASRANSWAWSSLTETWDRLDSVRDDPAILSLREEARRRADGLPAARWSSRWGLGFAASLLIGIALWQARTWLPFQLGTGAAVVDRAVATPATQALVRDASTGIGGRASLVLPDGTKVTLNTASAIHSDYSGHARRVTLIQGEAFFEVAKNKARPFIVLAGTRQVVAVGTAFNVRLQSHGLKVTLVEGRVRVMPPGTPPGGGLAASSAVGTVTLEAGSALVARDDGSDNVQAIDVHRETSWRTGRLVFEGQRLADVVTEMNRYSSEQLVIADSSIEDRLVSGVFEPTNGPAFARALGSYGIARVGSSSNSVIVLVAP